MTIETKGLSFLKNILLYSYIKEFMEKSIDNQIFIHEIDSDLLFSNINTVVPIF